MKKSSKDLLETVGYILLGVVAAYLLNFGLGLVLGTDLPVVAVVSDSMTHDVTTPLRHYEYLQGKYGYTEEEIDSWPITGGFLRGDALVVVGTEIDELKPGDVIVYDIKGQSTPIVHRVVEMNEDGNIVTKGDHNPSHDPWAPTNIHGKAVAVIPFLGWPKLLLTTTLGGLFK
ncbi:MAG: signal peptidase I [Candidatus Wukongarchaeota archaeon]|nr:signal peptidase I [Candidatus Wukongarchaeota archaeon]